MTERPHSSYAPHRDLLNNIACITPWGAGACPQCPTHPHSTFASAGPHVCLTFRLTGLPPNASMSSSRPLPLLPNSHCRSTPAASASPLLLLSAPVPALLLARAVLDQLLEVIADRNLHAPCRTAHLRQCVHSRLSLTVNSRAKLISLHTVQCQAALSAS